MSSNQRPIDESTVEALLRERYAAQRTTPESPDLELVARFLDGTVSAGEKARVEALLATDPELAESVALARDATSDNKVVSLAAARHARKRPAFSLVLAIAAAIIAVAGAALYLGDGAPGTDDAAMSGAGVGSGATVDHLLVHARGPGGGETLLGAGAELPTAGDTLTFEYASKLPGYLMVVELDMGGAVRVLYPASGAAAAAVPAAHRERLPDGARVGERQGCSWVIGVFANQPFGRADLEAADLASAATADCALPGLAAQMPFARTVESWPIHR